MCAIPFDGLHKDTVSRKQLETMQAQIKDAIPTGTSFACSRQNVRIKSAAQLFLP